MRHVRLDIRSERAGDILTRSSPFLVAPQRGAPAPPPLATGSEATAAKEAIQIQKAPENTPAPFPVAIPPSTSQGGTQPPSTKPNESITIPDSLGKPATAQGIQQAKGGLSLNFDQAGLYEVVTAFAEMLKINYMLLADLKGQVTIQTSGVIANDDLMGLFYQILQANGLTAVKDGDLYKIIPIKDAGRILPDLRTDSPVSIAAAPGVTIQIVPLHYISTQEMTKILTPFMSTEGSIIGNDASRTLLIIDQRLNLLKALQLIATFDVDLFANIKYRFLQPRNIPSKDMLPLLTKFMGLYNKGTKEEIEFLSLDKLNSILVITANDRLLAKVDELMSELDKPSQEAEPRIYIYFLKNSQAEEMAGTLNTIFGTTAPAPATAEKDANKNGPQTEAAAAAGVSSLFGTKPAPTPQAAAAPASIAKPKTATFGDSGSGSLRSQAKISKDEIRNALIIEAIPSDYQIIEKVLQRLDILPRQVLISVKLLEIQLNDDLNLGVEWSWNKVSASATTPNFWSMLAGSAGLNYVVGETNNWKAAISALDQKKKVNIISSPSVLASDNKPAKIDIATEIPVASSQITYDNTNTNKTQTDIQYRNTGVILDVTPHINEYGLVSMDVNQEVSETASSVSVGGSSYPSFFKRTVKTTLTVNDGQSVVIGGLISEKKSNSSVGVPFLSSLPLIGWIFGKTGDGQSKTELIVMITPKVIANLEDVDAVTREFSRKIGYEPHRVTQ